MDEVYFIIFINVIIIIILNFNYENIFKILITYVIINLFISITLLNYLINYLLIIHLDFNYQNFKVSKAENFKCFSLKLSYLSFSYLCLQ